MAPSTNDLVDAVGSCQGKAGRNLPADVRMVKRLLNAHAHEIGLAPPLDVNNPRCGERVRKAIEDFQRVVMHKGPPYGRVLPLSQGGTTLKALLKTAPAAAPGASLSPTVRQAMGYFVRQGWTTAQAAGIVANLERESRLNPRAVGDGGRAFGIGQWHPDRQEAFQSFIRHPIRTSTLAEQLCFVNFELTRGSERAAGSRLRTASTAEHAGSIVSQYYERPANRSGEATARGRRAQQLLNGYR